MRRTVKRLIRCANQVLEVDAQVAFGERTLQAIVIPDAIAQLPPELNIYPYDDLAGFQKKAAFYPMPPMEPDGDPCQLWTDWQDAYQQFKAA